MNFEIFVKLSGRVEIWHTLSEPKSKDKFVKQLHPTKIVKIWAIFVFCKKLYEKIQNFNTVF